MMFQKDTQTWIRSLIQKRHLLFLTGLVVILGFTVLFTVITLKYADMARQSVYQSLEDQIEAGGQQLKMYSNSLASDMHRIEKHLVGTSMRTDDTLVTYLNLVKDQQPDDILSVMVWDENGNPVSEIGRKLYISRVWRSEYLKNINAYPDKVFFSKAAEIQEISEIPGRTISGMSRPAELVFVVYTGVYLKGAVKGIVLCVVRAHAFFTRYSGALTDPGITAGFVIQDDGRILYHRQVELRGLFLNQVPRYSKLASIGPTNAETVMKPMTRHFPDSQSLIMAAAVEIENQVWITGVDFDTMTVHKKMLMLMYVLIGSVLCLGIIILWLVVTLIRLEDTRKTLRQKDRELVALLDNLGDMAWLKDEQSRYVLVNKAFEQEFGVSLPDIRYKTDFDFLPIEQAQAYRTDDRQVMKTGNAIRTEVSFPDSTGRLKWFEAVKSPILDEEGAVEGTVGTARNITDRKLAEERLRQSEERYKAIFKHTKDGVIVFQPVDECRDFIAIDINESSEKIEQVHRDQVIGRSIRQLFPGIEEFGILPTYQRVCSTGQSEHYPVSFYRDDRISGWRDSFVYKLASGELVAVYSDETRRIEIENQRKSLEARVLQMQKMEAIGTLAGGIAHDFNNILGAIIGYAEMSMMEDLLNNPGQLKAYLQQILKASHRAKDVIRQILVFSRKSEPQKMAIQLAPMIKEVIRLMRSTLPSTIQIHQNIESRTSSVLADPTQIHQVVMNLCTNAAHAMEQNGGTMDIGLCDVNLGPDDVTSDPELQPGSYVKLTVTDTGCGMSPEVTARIFEPYFTTKPTGKGSGMGLAVVHGIMKSYGGYVRVSSRKDCGTTFELYFPSSQGQAVSEEKQPSKQVIEGKGETILLIDDEPTLVETGKMLLERIGYRVKTAINPLEALEAFNAAPDDIDLVITDMTMPAMTGDVLASKMKDIRHDIPVILCTGYSDRIMDHTLTNTGITAVVTKPFMLRDLARIIRDVMRATS